MVDAHQNDFSSSKNGNLEFNQNIGNVYFTSVCKSTSTISFAVVLFGIATRVTETTTIVTDSSFPYYISITSKISISTDNVTVTNVTISIKIAASFAVVIVTSVCFVDRTSEKPLTLLERTRYSGFSFVFPDRNSVLFSPGERIPPWITQI